MLQLPSCKEEGIVFSLQEYSLLLNVPISTTVIPVGNSVTVFLFKNYCYSSRVLFLDISSVQVKYADKTYIIVNPNRIGK